MTPEQRWDPERYARNARFVADLAAPLLELLRPRRGERIVDLGCGDGVLTARIAAAGADVVGVDSSPEQVAAARAKGLNARVMDGHALSFDAEYDAVFSNAALHWMKRPADVVAGVRRALRPGGRMVAEMGGKGNVATIAAALSAGLERRGLDAAEASPWYFPAPAEYRRMLEEVGFAVDCMELLPRPTPLPGDMADWLETFGESFLLRLPPDQRADYIAETVESVRPALYSSRDGWIADYVRLRFSARTP